MNTDTSFIGVSFVRLERPKLIADKKDRIEDRARKVYIFKQKVLKSLSVSFTWR